MVFISSLDLFSTVFNRKASNYFQVALCSKTLKNSHHSCFNVFALGYHCKVLTFTFSDLNSRPENMRLTPVFGKS